MREYLRKITTSQDKKDEMLLSGDWTDSALREATVKSEQKRSFPATTVKFLQTSGPFSGVAGWREMQGGAGLSRGTISARFTQIYHLLFCFSITRSSSLLIDCILVFSQLMEAFHDIQRLRIEAGPGYALPILM